MMKLQSIVYGLQSIVSPFPLSMSSMRSLWWMPLYDFRFRLR